MKKTFVIGLLTISFILVSCNRQTQTPPANTNQQQNNATADQNVNQNNANYNGNEIPDITAEKVNLGYINQQGKYGFNYPKGWQIETNGSSAYINGYKFAGVGILSYKGKIQGYLDYLKKNIQNLEITNQKNVQIAGTDAVSYTQKNYFPQGAHYLIQRGDEIIGIFITDPILTNTTEEELKKFDIIINSFTLLK